MVMEEKMKHVSSVVSRRKLLQRAGVLAGAAAMGGSTIWTPTANAAPSWCLPGATIDVDFEHNRYHNASLDDLKCSRPTDGYAATKSGVLKHFSPNELRRTDYGLLLESWQDTLNFWSRDLTKSVWKKTHISAAPAPVGADGTKAGGTRLKATSNNAKVIQTLDHVGRAIYWDSPQTAGHGRGGAIHEMFYIKRVKGTGPVKIVANCTANAWYDVTALLNTHTYTQVCVYYYGLPTSNIGLQMGTAGDEIDVDMAQFEAEGHRNCVSAFSPFPTTDKILTRATDYVTVMPQSKLYKALAGKRGTVFVKSFNLLGDNGAFYHFRPPAYGRIFGLASGSSPYGAFWTHFQDGPFGVRTRVDHKKLANYAWQVPIQGATSMTHDAATVRTVLTWGDGKSSVVANNGKVGIGKCTTADASGPLYLGLGGDFPTKFGHHVMFMVDGYIQRLTFIPDVVAGHGAALTVGPETIHR